MYKVVIVDDQVVFANKTAASVQEFFKEQGLVSDITCYDKPELLRYDILEDKSYDIYILDVEMPGINGIQLAEEIRQRDGHAVLIFMTAYENYSLKAFDVQAQHYILKSQADKKLQKVLKQVCRLITAGERFYLISTNTRQEKVYYKDIYYFYKDGKNVNFIKSDGETFIRETIQKVMETLDAPEFIYIDRGSVVNIIHIMKIHSRDMYLRNGQRLVISKGHLKQVKTLVHEYWKGQLS